MIKVIETDNAPKAIGPYSQAVYCGNMLFISGQIGINPNSGQLIAPDLISQTKQVFENIHSICKEAGAELNHIVKLGIYLTDLNYFSEVNELMTQYFNAPYPARSTVEVSALPRQALIEVDAIVYF